MELYFLRHAIAVERGTPGYEDDSRRPLTDEGRAKMQNNARGMKALDISFDAVLSSPYVRAEQTAAIVASVFKIRTSDIRITEQLTPFAAFEDLLKELTTHFPKARRILLVGHEPHLSGMVSFLLVGGQSIPIEFKKGGLCSLRAEKLSGPGSATFNWMLTPAQLRLLAGGNKQLT